MPQTALEKVRLGRTGLMVSRLAMGCLPLQRLDKDGAVRLLRRAFDAGVNFFDTAHVYTDSEEKIGAAFPGSERRKVIIASKALCDTYEETTRQLETSLKRLGTDYIDLYQWHNPEDMTDFQTRRGPYQAILDAQRAGKVRHVGLSSHNIGRARAAVDAGAFATIQYPLSVLSSPEEIAFTEYCRDRDVGVIAMKAMCGGMLPDGRIPFVFLNQHPHIVPIWGIEKESELEQFLTLAANPEPFTHAMREEVEAIRREFGDEFCRGCGYCLPCPASIALPILMRVDCFIKRTPVGSQFTPERRGQIARIADCVECRACVQRCPYHLDIPVILRRQKENYEQLCAQYDGKN